MGYKRVTRSEGQTRARTEDPARNTSLGESPVHAQSSFELEVPSSDSDSDDCSQEVGLLVRRNRNISEYDDTDTREVSDDGDWERPPNKRVKSKRPQSPQVPSLESTGKKPRGSTLENPIPAPSPALSLRNNNSDETNRACSAAATEAEMVPVPRPISSENGQITMVRNELSLLRGVLNKMPDILKEYIDTRFDELKAAQRQTREDLVEIRAVLDLSSVDKKKQKESVKTTEIELPFFNFVFSDEVMQVVIEKCTIRHVSTTAMEFQSRNDTKNSDLALLARGASLALRIILFAVNLKKKESRSMYKTALGQRFSEFRESIVLSALHAAKNNKFNIFRSSEDVTNHDVDVEVDMKSRKARMPKWLQKDFINGEHISYARMRSEETAENGKALDGKSTLKDERFVDGRDRDIALFAATKIYQRFTQKLTTARMMAKAGFFDEVGYLFVDWKSFGCKADQSTLSIRWSSEVPKEIPDIQTVPNAIPRYTSKKDEDTDEAELSTINRMNKQLLSKLIAQCGHLELEVEHQVCIRKHAKKGGEKLVAKNPEKDLDRDKSNSESTSENALVDEEFVRMDNISYRISLVEISCRLLSGYTSQLQYTSPASFLCASEDSLRCIFCVSLLLKELLDKVIADLNGTGVDARVNGICLCALLPTPARQRNGLRTRCVHMFDSLFQSKTLARAEVEDSVGTEDEGTRNTTVIEID